MLLRKDPKDALLQFQQNLGRRGRRKEEQNSSNANDNDESDYDNHNHNHNHHHTNGDTSSNIPTS